jgi:hypothetical protein
MGLAFGRVYPRWEGATIKNGFMFCNGSRIRIFVFTIIY